MKDIKGVLLGNTKNGMDGTVDSLRYLTNNSDQYSIQLMTLLLKAFQSTNADYFSVHYCVFRARLIYFALLELSLFTASAVLQCFL